MTNVTLGGWLGKRYGRKWKLAVSTPREAIAMIECNRPGFIHEWKKMPAYAYRVRVGRRAINAERLDFKHGEKSISITPVLTGAGNTGKGIGEIIGGIVLFAVGVILQGTPLGFLSPSLYGLGLSLILGGVSTLLSPTPNTDIENKPNKNKPSFQFDGPVNVVDQGGPVPVLLGGPMWIGSTVVSAGVYSKDITQGSTSPTSGTGGTGTSNTGPNSPAIPAYRQHSNF